jgi:hypothetical protein
MALTFPSSPSNGQIYTDTTTGNRYIYNATAGVWSFAANNVGMSVSSTPPSNVAPGAMWFNREIGRTFVYYDDGDSKQWIETVPAGAVDTNTIAAYTNPVFASMNGAYTTANAAFNTANAAFASANNVAPQVTPSFNTANAAFSFSNTVNTFAYGVAVNAAAAFAAANNVGPQIAPAFNTANAAFGKANTALQNTSGVSFNGNFYVPSGNVGIGTSSPSAKLTTYFTGLYDTSTARYVDIVGDFTGTNAASATNAGAFTGIRFGYTALSGKYTMIGSVSEDSLGYARTNGLSFWTSAVDTAPVERLRITGSGNVGIGTSSPGGKFHIQDASNRDSTGHIMAENISTSTLGLTNSQILVKNRYGASQFMQWENNGLRIGSRWTANSGSGNIYITSGSDTTSMTIDSSGYVTKPYHPYLRVSATGSTSPSLTTGLTIPYNTILEQVGSNYNTSTYRFTAPVAGVYAVYATMQASGTNTTYSNLMICKNGGQITGTYKNMTGATYQMMDAVAYVKCAVSDYISVIYYASSTSGSIENVDARNSFLVYFLG